MRSALKRLLRQYALCFPIWTVVGLFFFSQGLTQKFLSRDPSPWWHYLAAWMIGVYIFALLTPGVLWLGDRLPISRRNWPRRVPLHLLFSLAVAFLQLVANSAALHRMHVFPATLKTFEATFFFLVMIGFHQNVMTYWMILGIQYAFRYYQRYQERERDALRLELNASELKAQLVDARLNALKGQLQPHFLFNTLNAIMVLVRQEKTSEAEEMLARLSDLLRCVLENVEAQEVPLRRELEYLKLYLSIEQVRFQDRLRVLISADPDVLDAAFPHMALQPIVENAIRHGIGRSSATGEIQISAWHAGENLEIRVRNDGPPLNTDSNSTARGIGLANTRARLHHLYGDAAGLTLENCEQGGVAAAITLPFHLMSQPAEAETIELHAANSLGG